MYDLMGPVTVGAGLGASYAAAKPGGVSWLALFVALCAGVLAFVVMRRFVVALRPERALLAWYIVTPVAVLLATMVTAWGVRALVR
jgi:hypothetical protein